MDDLVTKKFKKQPILSNVCKFDNDLFTMDCNRLFIELIANFDLYLVNYEIPTRKEYLHPPKDVTKIEQVIDECKFNFVCLNFIVVECYFLLSSLLLDIFYLLDYKDKVMVPEDTENLKCGMFPNDFCCFITHDGSLSLSTF